jgi:Spy/CpxP family protein refolding chaperone
MRKEIIILVVSVALLGSGAVLAALDKDERAKVDTLAETLQLDKDQKGKVIKEREDSKKKLDQLEQKWQKLHDQLRGEVRKDNPDQQKVDKLTREIGSIRGEIISLRTNSLLYLKSILTKEQKQIVNDGLSAKPATTAPEK